MRFAVIGAGMAVLAVSGCESFEFDSRTAEEQAYADLQDESAMIAAELDLLSVTPVANIPVSGSATYDGTALIALATPARPSELIGTATLTARFGPGADTISGTIDGFYGTINGGAVDAFDGEIRLTGGNIDRTDSTVLAVSANGILSNDDNSLNVGADLDGNFRGLTPRGVVLESDDDSVFRLNGPAVSGDMEVIGLRR
jgi:hypothetical protein